MNSQRSIYNPTRITKIELDTARANRCRQWPLPISQHIVDHKVPSRSISPARACHPQEIHLKCNEAESISRSDYPNNVSCSGSSVLGLPSVRMTSSHSPKDVSLNNQESRWSHAGICRGRSTCGISANNSNSTNIINANRRLQQLLSVSDLLVNADEAEEEEGVEKSPNAMVEKPTLIEMEDSDHLSETNVISRSGSCASFSNSATYGEVNVDTVKLANADKQQEGANKRDMSRQRASLELEYYNIPAMAFVAEARPATFRSATDIHSSNVWGAILKKRNPANCALKTAPYHRGQKRTGGIEKMDKTQCYNECREEATATGDTVNQDIRCAAHSNSQASEQILLVKDSGVTPVVNGEQCGRFMTEKQVETTSNNFAQESNQKYNSHKKLGTRPKSTCFGDLRKYEIVSEVEEIVIKKVAPSTKLNAKNVRLSECSTKRWQTTQSPPDIVYPPYLQVRTERGKAKSGGNSNNTTDQTRRNGTPEKGSNRRIGSTMFWKSLMGETDENEEPFPSVSGHSEVDIARRCLKENADKTSDCGDSRREVYKYNTGYQVPGHVGPSEVAQRCHAKGYEILRKLVRGKFKHHTCLYLANNQTCPEFSPVEIAIVKFSSRSSARSFLEACYPGNKSFFKSVHHNIRKADRMCAALLPRQKNLLPLLHVFMAGNCVYQVSSHCQWPPLSQLIDSATPAELTSYDDTGIPSPGKASFSSSVYGDVCDREVSSNHRNNHGGQAVWMTDMRSSAVRATFASVGGKRSQANIRQNHILPEAATKKIFRQICNGLFHLHEHGVLHGDLNCSNILVTDKLQVKLAGYGPICLHTAWTSPRGELFDHPITDHYDVYMPPEILAKRSYRAWSSRSDIWCLGMVLLHMTFGEVSPEINSAVRLQRSRKFKSLCAANMSYQMSLLVDSLLQLRPKDRPNIEEVSAHAWLSDGTEMTLCFKDRGTQASPNFRTDGRTFPLPKRVREAFSTCPTCSFTDEAEPEDAGECRYETSTLCSREDGMGSNDCMTETIRSSQSTSFEDLDLSLVSFSDHTSKTSTDS